MAGEELVGTLPANWEYTTLARLARVVAAMSKRAHSEASYTPLTTCFPVFHRSCLKTLEKIASYKMVSLESLLRMLNDLAAIAFVRVTSFTAAAAMLKSGR